MDWLIAGIFAAALAWAFNTWTANWGGSLSLIILVPLIEETAKTGLVWLIGGSLVLSHAVFGLVEAVYEMRRDKQPGAAAMAITLHLVFGLVTLGLLRYSGSWVVAVIGASALHALWNLLIIRFFTRWAGGKIS